VTGASRYDRIGRTYAATRRPDPRIAAQLAAALGDARTVANVGAGTGNYEPADRSVVAVEPSATMVGQRPYGAAPVVRAAAERLPFGRDAFDGSLALLTVHHWSDAAAGLAEVRRVTAGPVVVLTFDHDVHSAQWLVTDYFPEMVRLDGDVLPPDGIAEALGGGTVEVVPVPADCVDGFCHAFWARPSAYLDPDVRAGISGIARLPDGTVDRAVARLGDDLATGRWHERHGSLLGSHAIDAGYRLVVSAGATGGARRARHRPAA
jgi:SAM-dependent methyltransferase